MVARVANHFVTNGSIKKGDILKADIGTSYAAVTFHPTIFSFRCSFF